MAPPPFKFLRQDGWFQFPTPADISISTSTTTGLLSFINATTTSSISFSTAAFTDVLSVSQGSSGTWYVSGTITLLTTIQNSSVSVKLWDGTSVINSAATLLGPSAPASSGYTMPISLSGALAAPAGNLKISGLVTVAGGTGGVVGQYGSLATTSINTLTAVRIG